MRWSSCHDGGIVVDRLNVKVINQDGEEQREENDSPKYEHADDIQTSFHQLTRMQSTRMFVQSSPVST